MLRITKAIQKQMERPQFTRFWGQRYKIHPKFVRGVLGDGRQLISFTPMMTRPEHYFIRIDSSWQVSNFDSDGMCVAEHVDEIVDLIENEYGYYFDGQSSEFEGSNGKYPGWPVFWNEGYSWGSVDIQEFKPKPRKRSRVAA
jgi:hypothetical protein